jgi:hypothetical protein
MASMIGDVHHGSHNHLQRYEELIRKGRDLYWSGLFGQPGMADRGQSDA